MTNRKAIPDKVQAKIMDKSAARCAICYSTRMNTDVVYPVPGFQSAHIDQNAANCAENNLYPATPCTTQSSGRLKRFCRIKAASGNVLFFAMLLAHTSDPKSL
ncbi:hypothetical protein STW0522ENT66_P12680 (plasmid) [Enterobacter roggenkampii]|nr:hypothetical protein YA51_17430 [Enterobacter kobei]BBV94462.1 hypothetical protein STW0522ENT66_P12680 [Enterobacter roggenkampii]HBZ1120196.1 hypothetical protein [Klebsiella pneumoniae]